MNNPQSGKAVTLKDIASKLGLSRGSVSKALKDDPEIATATRESVHRAAREMGYKPNPMGAGLAEFRRTSKIAPVHSTLAWIDCRPEPAKLRSYAEFGRYWQGALQLVREIVRRCRPWPSFPPVEGSTCSVSSRRCQLSGGGRITEPGIP